MVRLSWKCDNDSAILTIYRSKRPIDLNDLPAPLASNLSGSYFIDEDVSSPYHYMIKSEFDGRITYSLQVSTEAILSGNFIFDLSENYNNPSGNSVNFIWNINV